MAEFDYSSLRSAYEGFTFPLVQVIVEGEVLSGEEVNMAVTRVEVELTSGYEASIATIELAGAFDPDVGRFNLSKDRLKFIYMGSMVQIAMGYGANAREIFRGFVARVHFLIPESESEDVPRIEVTALDVKGLMMANRHSKRLNSKNFSDAVKEVLRANPFVTLKDAKNKDFMEMVVHDTPDKNAAGGGGAGGAGGAGGGGGGQEATTDKRVEMVEESDYEFVVKAAKKYNFEFFIIGKIIYFVEAKSNDNVLINLTPECTFHNLDVGYDITGLVKSVEVRNVDMEQGKYVGTKKKLNSKISLGNKAKPLIENQSLVYLDPTADSKEEAGYRADYLLNSVDYRLGSIQAVIIGMPEIVPGRFITLSGFGSPIDNTFYVTSVKHILDGGSYRTEIEGCANSISK
ncbi:MAG: hypothetical protein K5989_04985 [Lachnospiraceae bacterium]|nr:hypothetical protein [Lachnospiraceae bacterium]